MFGRDGKLIIAHRGASARERENTLEAFSRAIELGADMIEFDIRKTADGVLVVHHDGHIRRRAIGALRYSEVDELSAREGFHVPSLEEVLAITRGRIGLNAELKETGYEGDVVEVIRKYYGDKDFTLTSFQETSVSALKDADPRLPAGLILKSLDRGALAASRADFFVPHWKMLDETFLDWARRNRKPLLVWTVNDRRKLKRYLSDERIYGVITDEPDLAVEVREEAEAVKAGKSITGQFKGRS